MKRREFIILLGGGATVAWPLVVRAQQPANLLTIGFLGSATPATQGQWVAALGSGNRQPRERTLVFLAFSARCPKDSMTFLKTSRELAKEMDHLS